MSDLSINRISSAVLALSREADRAYNRAIRAEHYDDAKWLRTLAQEAEKELALLSKHMEGFRSYLRDKDAAYDRYVTRFRDDDEPSHTSCTCFISAPCSFCTRQVDEDEE